MAHAQEKLLIPAVSTVNLFLDHMSKTKPTPSTLTQSIPQVQRAPQPPKSTQLHYTDPDAMQRKLKMLERRTKQVA
jgi:hypothetical protein